MAAQPRVLVLDESVAALDVSIQAQILNTLADVRETTAVSGIVISHDLPVIRQVAGTALVVRSGELVEQGDTEQLLLRPQHPYTQRLLASLPRRGWKPQRALAGTDSDHA